MKHNNLPSIGFILLLCSLTLVGYFFYWAIGPLSYEKAQILEKQGHQFFKEKRYKQAAQAFLQSAKIKDDPVSMSRRYRCAGTACAASGNNRSFEYYLKALEFNGENAAALSAVKVIFNRITCSEEFLGFYRKTGSKILKKIAGNTSVFYLNRYPDGWTRGSVGEIVIINEKSKNGTLIFFSSIATQSLPVDVNVKINNQETIKKIWLLSTKPHKTKFSLENDINIIQITTQTTFIPRKHNINNDTRELGINFRIEIG